MMSDHDDLRSHDYMSVPDELQKHPFTLDTPEDTLKTIAGLIDLVNSAHLGRARRGDLSGAYDATELMLNEVGSVVVRLAQHMDEVRKRACEPWRGRVNQSPTVLEEGDDHG